MAYLTDISPVFVPSQVIAHPVLMGSFFFFVVVVVVTDTVLSAFFKSEFLICTTPKSRNFS